MRDAGRGNDSRKLWFATLESKETNKRKGKPSGDFSKAGAVDRESNVEHMQAAVSSNGGEKNWRGLRGLAIERKRKRKGNGSWAGRFELGLGGAEREDERR